jgi:PadR family transcriptional regulator
VAALLTWVLKKIIFWSMPKRGTPPIHGDMIQGTLDVLVLKTLALGPAHGHTIAHAIERRSEDVLQVEHGSC